MMAIRLSTQAAQRRQRSFCRQSGERLSHDLLLKRAAWLPEEERHLLTAHLVHGVSTEELASVARMSERRMRRRLESIQRKLEDRWFGLTMRYAATLPTTARMLAVARWVEGRPLRGMATSQGITLHQLRQMLKVIQGQMMFMVGHEGERRAEEPGNDE